MAQQGMDEEPVDHASDRLAEASVLLGEFVYQFRNLIRARALPADPEAATAEAKRRRRARAQFIHLNKLRRPILPLEAAIREIKQRHPLSEDDLRRLAELERTHAPLRRAFDQILGGLNRSALCLSGGGIRSGSFALGVLQALATYPRRLTNHPSAPDDALLGQMDFLSTVSGGGYIGGWLSAWLSRMGYAAVQPGLVERPLPAQEPPAIENLRRYSNFLTPKLGVLSADSWTAMALYCRNLFLNWLILIPAMCLPLILLKLLAGLAAIISRDTAISGDLGHILVFLPLAAVAVALLAMIYALRNVTLNRPTYAEHGITQKQFFLQVLLPVVIAAIAWSAFVLTPQVSAFLRDPASLLPDWLAGSLFASTKAGCTIVGAAIGFSLYSLGWLAAGRNLQPREVMRRHFVRARSVHRDISVDRQRTVDWLFFALGGLVYGAMLGVGIYLFHILPEMLTAPAAQPCDKTIPLAAGSVDLVVRNVLSCGAPSQDLAALAWQLRLYAVVALGLPWLILAQLTGEAVFVGLASFARNADSDREWLGRAAGWYMLTATGWIVTVLLVYGGSTWLLQFSQGAGGSGGLVAHLGWLAAIKGGVTTISNYLAPLGGISAVVTALLGSSARTGGKGTGRTSSITDIIAENALTICSIIFLIALVVFLSCGLDKILLGASLFDSDLLAAQAAGPWLHDVAWLVAGLLCAAGVMLGASKMININRFSLHALYRNRLIREFLGASNFTRNPNRFTDFAIRDNCQISDLKGAHYLVRGRYRLLHMVNTTLNLVGTSNLAWQERKGESFTFSPLHSGAAALGYRHSEDYAAGESDGITLGTTMAISGAAASPNMGYHSSPLITFIMTLLNVRLGWWLGNPGKEKFDLDGPSMAVYWMLAEAFGATTDEKDFIYLSDGGHFENLALYEMVRRRCRYIILSDAGCDPECALEDLGNAVRKIEIDLGVRITFQNLQELKPRLSLEEALAGKVQEKQECWCVGRICYYEADYRDGEAEAEAEANDVDGYLLYVKPSFRGMESAGVRAYALANEAFPHEATADQWFSESQFESYRKLGFETLEEILAGRMPEAAGIAARKRGPGAVPTLEDLFKALSG